MPSFSIRNSPNVLQPSALASSRSISNVRLNEVKDPDTLSSWVFCSEQGTPIDGHNLRARWWKPLLDAAQLPPIRLHDLRGSVVSLLLNDGLTPWEVQSYIGHRSLVMTCNTYGHRYPGSSRVEDALSKFVPVTTG